MIKLCSYEKLENVSMNAYSDDTIVNGERHTLLVCNCREKDFFYIREAESLIKKHFKKHKDVVMIKISVKPESENYVFPCEVNSIIEQIRENANEFGISENFAVLYCHHWGNNFVVCEKYKEPTASR